MTLRRIVALVSAVILVFCLLSGCGKDNGSDVSSAVDVGNVIDDNAPPVLFSANSGKLYVVVRPAGCTDEFTDISVRAFKALKENLGIPGVKNVYDDTERAAESVEIILGETSREESAEVKALFISKKGGKATDFAICAVKGNIVVYAKNMMGYNAAIDELCNNVLKTEVAGNLCDMRLDDKAYSTMTINGNTDLSDYKIVRSHYTTSYITQCEIEKLQEAITEKYGYYLPIVEDAYVEKGDMEIVIGGSNRDGQTEIDDYDAYEIKAVGNKLYLNGGNDWSIAMAVTEFTKAVNAGNVSITDGVFMTGDYASTIDTYDRSKYYKYVWGDDFEDPVINEKMWMVSWGGLNSSQAADGKTVYRNSPESTYIKDGCLYQCSLKTADAYYGGMLTTKSRMHMRYGYLEIKNIIQNGSGFWSCLWLWNSGIDATLNKPFNFEIDITESFGNASSYTHAMHRLPTSIGESLGYEHTTNNHTAACTKYCDDKKTFNEDFHTMGCLWTPESVTFTCDGIAYETHDISIDPVDQLAFNNDAYILCSLATNFVNCPVNANATEEQWEVSNKYIVDYIHLYQIDSDILKIMY